MVRPFASVAIVSLCVFVIGFTVAAQYSSALAYGITGAVLLLIGVFALITQFDLDAESSLRLNYVGMIVASLGAAMSSGVIFEIAPPATTLTYIATLILIAGLFLFMGSIGALVRDLTRDRPYTKLTES